MTSDELVRVHKENRSGRPADRVHVKGCRYLDRVGVKKRWDQIPTTPAEMAAHPEWARCKVCAP